MCDLKSPSSTERSRLRLLRELNILTSPKEDAIQRIVLMASRVFKMPMIGMTFMDHSRHIVKYSCGIEASEIPRPVCLCSLSYVDDTAPILTARDTLLNDSMRDHPFVTGGPRIRFYCGASIFIDGVKVGVICLLDVQPHPDFSETQQELLIEMANCAADLLNNKRILEKDQNMFEDVITQHHILADVKAPLHDVNETVRQMRQMLLDSCLCSFDSSGVDQNGDKVGRDVGHVEKHVLQLEILSKYLKKGVHDLESRLDASIQKLLRSHYE